MILRNGRLGVMPIQKLGPRPVCISQRADLWVIPSRSEKDVVRFVVIWGSNPRKAACSCPAGASGVLCYHIKRVNIELRRMKRA